MPEENCHICGMELDGSKHECSWRAPDTLNNETISTINNLLVHMTRYLQQLERQM